MKLRNSNVDKIEHYGKRNVPFEVEGEEEDEVMAMGFQTSDVQKPLAAVHRIVEQGNPVKFGPQKADDFIVNVDTGGRVYLRKKGRSYVLDADFLKKEQSATSTTVSFQRQP